MQIAQSFNMLTLSGEKGVAANSRIRSGDDSSAVEVDRASKKARVSKSPGTSDSSASSKLNLRVDVNAPLLASPRSVPNGMRRSPVADVGDVLVSEERRDGGNLQSAEQPFVIARKLLRRRHVRKEQVRKEREATLNQRNGRNQRNNRRARNNRASRRQGGMRRAGRIMAVPAGDAEPLLRPQLSPMILKVDSFFDTTHQSPVKLDIAANGNASWAIDGRFAPAEGTPAEGTPAEGTPAEGTSPPCAKAVVTPEVIAPAAPPIVFPRNNSYSNNMNRVSFSPLRPRHRM